MIIDFQEKTVKTPVDGISPLDFAALQMLSICEQVPKSIALELLHLPAAGYPFATKNLKEQNIYF